MAALNESQIRAQALLLLQEKYSYSLIAKRLNRSKAWVVKWANRYKQNSDDTLQNRRQLKRRSVLTVAAQKIILKCKYRRGQSVRKLEHNLKAKKLAGSRETIRRYLRHKLKWRSLKRMKVPKLTAAYKTRRVNFAKRYKDIDWSRVMFSDESPFKLFYAKQQE
jgi:transposase